MLAVLVKQDCFELFAGNFIKIFNLNDPSLFHGFLYFYFLDHQQ